MDELRKTPEQRPVTDANEEIDTSPPLKPLNRPVAGHNAEELARRTMHTGLRDISVGAMWKFLGKTKEGMSKTFPKVPQMQRVADPYTQYLNILSDAVHKELDKSSQGLEIIRFFNRHNNPPKNHDADITSPPDFFAMKLRAGESTPSEFPWSALVATGEILSGDNKEKSRAETAAYTSYLLQARPDMVTVLGIYVDPNGFRLVASNACGAFNTKYLEWDVQSSRLLLYAWIWRLYEPDVDPSITVNIERGQPVTFKITLPKATYLNCKIHSAGPAFGRRTIILTCPEPEIVIKEQYNETSRRFEEGPTLDKIHKNGAFPGVVRPGWHGLVGSSKEEELVVNWEESERNKTRVVLLDKGEPIMDTKTPREVLVAMYDLLEITRFLHKKRKILHRDISKNNVLLRDVVPPYTSSADNNVAPAATANTSSIESDLPPAVVPVKQSIAEEFQEMCFASYLLHTKCNSSPRPGRLDTGVLLIDFDMSEDQEPDNQAGNKKPPQARAGTPIFFARDVVSDIPKEGTYVLAPMPKLDQGYQTYEAAVPDRLEAFPPNPVELYQILSDTPHESFKHKLQYDAESVFWLLLWWAIHAYPLEGTSSDDKEKEIDDRVWTALTGKQDADLDPRVYFVPFFPRGGVVHPVYKPLESLLREMAQQLSGDHERGEDRSRKQDDYLHEAFQRIIFKFLFTRYDEGFMTTQKRPELRQPKKMSGMEGSLSAHHITRTRVSAAPFSHSAQSVPSCSLRSASSLSIPSDPSLKRKRPNGDASNSDPNDEDYTNKPKRRK